jgi:glycosyltransferase involved in cell wall biosynthesis
VPAEVIIALDQASSDDSAAIAASYGAPVVVVPVPPRAGTPATTNRGIAAAHGDVLCLLDADDLWCPGKTAAQLAVLAERPEIDAVFGMIRQFLSEDMPPELAARLYCPAEPMRGLHRSTMMVRRAALERVGAFEETLHHGDFIDWYARARELGLGMHTLDAIVARRRIHGTNYGIRERPQQRAQNLLALKRALDRRRGA